MAAAAHLVPVSAKTAWIILSVRLEDGTQGFGEATRFGEETGVLAEVAALDARLAAERPVGVAPALALLAQRQMSGPRTAVLIALEAALRDAMARQAGLPLADLLGGPYRQAVPVYANINRGIAERSPEGFAARAREVVALGYGAVKIAPFDGLNALAQTAAEAHAAFARGLARIAAVREAIGPERGLHIDCHERFGVKLARDLMRETAPFAPFWIEDAVREDFPAEDLRALRGAAHAAGTMIAGGEGLETLREASDLYRAGTHDVVLPDLRFTGIATGLAMLAAAPDYGVAASIHNPAGPVLDGLSRQVAQALPAFLVLERQVAESDLYDALRGGPAALDERGAVRPDPGAGLGFTPDLSLAEHADGIPAALNTSFAGLAGAGPDA